MKFLEIENGYIREDQVIRIFIKRDSEYYRICYETIGSKILTSKKYKIADYESDEEARDTAKRMMFYDTIG